MALDSLGWSGQTTVDLAETIVDRHVRSGKADTHRDRVGRRGRHRTAHHIRRTGVGKRSLREFVAARRRRQRRPRRDRSSAHSGGHAGDRRRVPRRRRSSSRFSPDLARDAVAYRISHSGAKVVCVDRRYRDLVPSSDSLTVISVGGSEHQDDIDYHRALACEDAQCVSQRYARDEPAAIIYTSGSTGLPKGCVIAANILAAMWPYARYGLDLRAETDVFWPTGDPSWGYGLCCYLPALAMGMPVLVRRARMRRPRSAATSSHRYKVTNLATTPTVLRSLMAQGEVMRDVGSTVRAISSCGEPLNAEVVEFFRDCLGCRSDGSFRSHGIRLADRQPQWSCDAGEARLDGAPGAGTMHGGRQ